LLTILWCNPQDAIAPAIRDCGLAVRSTALCLSCFGKDDQPFAEENEFNMPALNAGAAIQNWIERVITGAEVAAGKYFASAQTHEERGRSVLHAEPGFTGM
jgi:hypothetical protein